MTQTDEIRELLAWLGETPQLDKLEEFGVDRGDVKKYKTIILEQVAREQKTKDGRPMPPINVIYRELMNLQVKQLVGPA